MKVSVKAAEMVAKEVELLVVETDNWTVVKMAHWMVLKLVVERVILRVGRKVRKLAYYLVFQLV